MGANESCSLKIFTKLNAQFLQNLWVSDTNTEQPLGRTCGRATTLLPLFSEGLFESLFELCQEGRRETVERGLLEDDQEPNCFVK